MSPAVAVSVEPYVQMVMRILSRPEPEHCRGGYRPARSAVARRVKGPAGQEFESAPEAAGALGVSVQTMYAWLRAPEKSGWRYCEPPPPRAKFIEAHRAYDGAADREV